MQFLLHYEALCLFFILKVWTQPFLQEKIGDIKEVIKNPISKKDRQYNDQMKREKRQLIDDKTLGLNKTNPTKTVDEFIMNIYMFISNMIIFHQYSEIIKLLLKQTE